MLVFFRNLSCHLSERLSAKHTNEFTVPAGYYSYSELMMTLNILAKTVDSIQLSKSNNVLFFTTFLQHLICDSFTHNTRTKIIKNCEKFEFTLKATAEDRQ